MTEFSNLNPYLVINCGLITISRSKVVSLLVDIEQISKKIIVLLILPNMKRLTGTHKYFKLSRIRKDIKKISS